METLKAPGGRTHHASDGDRLAPPATEATDLPTIEAGSDAELLATTDTPYGSTGEAWAQLGWSPIPVTRSKMPTAGVTGWEGAEVDTFLARDLGQLYPRHNVGLRMRRGWIGIDLDAYHAGLDTLARAVEAWGDLPPTIWSTNREDGSGIYYYRCAPELVTVGNLDRIMGKGIDLIQRHHRFAVVCGTHASGRRYRTCSGGIFSPWAAAELPQRWAEGLRKAKHAEVAARSAREASGTWHGGGPARLTGLLRAVETAAEGERNSVLFWAACRAFEISSGGDDLGAELLGVLLARAAGRAGLAAAEADPTIDSARRTVGR